MATIIKTDEPQRQSGSAFRAVAYDLTDLAAQADTYLGRVRGQAAQIVEQAKREADAIQLAFGKLAGITARDERRDERRDSKSRESANCAPSIDRLSLENCHSSRRRSASTA